MAVEAVVGLQLWLYFLLQTFLLFFNSPPSLLSNPPKKKKKKKVAQSVVLSWQRTWQQSVFLAAPVEVRRFSDRPRQRGVYQVD